MSSEFPWKKIDTVVKEGHKGGEINKLELEEWQMLYKQSESKGKEYEKDELAMRQIMNDVLLWGLAIDFATGEVPEMEGVLNGFGWKKFTLWFGDVGLPFGLKE
jgi:hypothetical protein